MVAKLLIRPKAGLVVRDPRNGMPLPAERTTEVDTNQFWLRRVRDGDVIVGEYMPTMPPVEEMKKKVFKKKKSDEIEAKSDDSLIAGA